MTGPRKEPLRTRLARWLRIFAILAVVPTCMAVGVQMELGWTLWAGIVAGAILAALFVPTAVLLHRTRSRQ